MARTDTLGSCPLTARPARTGNRIAETGMNYKDAGGRAASRRQLSVRPP